MLAQRINCSVNWRCNSNIAESKSVEKRKKNISKKPGINTFPNGITAFTLKISTILVNLDPILHDVVNSIEEKFPKYVPLCRRSYLKRFQLVYESYIQAYFNQALCKAYLKVIQLV